LGGSINIILILKLVKTRFLDTVLVGVGGKNMSDPGQRIKVFEEVDSLRVDSIVKGDINVESTWSFESAVELVGVIG
jgi:hypothetical protein